MLQMLNSLARPIPLAVPHVGIPPGDIFSFRNAPDTLVQRAFLAPSPAIGTQANMVHMRHGANKIALAILHFNNGQPCAGVQDMRNPVTIMPLRRLPLQRIEARCHDT